MKLTGTEMTIYQYNFTPKPDLLLNLGDAFTWSIPMLSKAMLDMFIAFLTHTSDTLTDPAFEHVILQNLPSKMLRELKISPIITEQESKSNPSHLEALIEEEKLKQRTS